METIYIYNGESRISVPVTDSAERSHSLQQQNYVKLVWKSAENTPILANAYIEYEGQVFYCLDDYFPTHMDGIYEYDIEFHAIEDTFNRPLFFRYVDVLDQTTGQTTSWKEIEWSLNSNLRTIAEIVVDSLNRAYDNAYFALPNDSYADTLLLSYSFASNSIADALSTIAEQNETEWWLETTDEYVDGKRKYILHFDKCELGDTIELNDNYTEDANGVWQSGGLKSVSQSGNTNIIPQKLYVYGSERNIIKKTVEQEVAGGVMNVSYDKKLRLPSIFPNGTKEHVIESAGVTLSLNDDSSISIGGINNHFEKVKIFDEVYPKMDMEVTAVSVQNPNSENPIYWLKGDRLTSITDEAPVDGSINPGKLGLLIEGCTLMCTFTSGLLNGREFECAWRESSAEIGLISIDENDVQIPSGVFKPQEGDTFILWNLAMPQSSITIAQNELCVEAINYIEELVTSITETDCTTEAEATRISDLNTKIKVGQRISVNSNVFRNGRLSSRIIKFSCKLTKPYDISFTLASSRQTGRLATLQNLIADVTHEVHSVGQVQRAISRRQWHDTEEMMLMLDSIQKQMVVVGDENNSFTTTCNVAYNDTNKELFISKGYLQHQSYTDNEWKGAWLIEQDKTISMPALDEKGVTPFYVYFVCSKDNNTGYAEIGSALPQFNDNYVFVLGILSSEFEGERIFNQSSGLTSIAGGTITTDVVQDPGRRLIIDYSNATIIARNGATIKGAIEFEKGEGENDLGTAIEGLLNGVNNAQSTANSASSKATQAQEKANEANNAKYGNINIIGRVSMNGQTHLYTNTAAQETLFGEEVRQVTKAKTGFGTLAKVEFNVKKGISYVASVYYKNGTDLPSPTNNPARIVFSQEKNGVETTIKEYKTPPLSTEWAQMAITHIFNEDSSSTNKYYVQVSPHYTASGTTYFSCLKVQEGNKPTEGYEATSSDIQEAKDSIDAVSGSLDDVSAQLEDAFKDGYFNKTEQKALKASVGELENSYNAFVKEYLDVANSKYLDDVSVTISGTSYTTPKTSLTTKYASLVSAYNNYHGVLQGLCNVKFGTITKPNIGTVAEVSIPNTDSRLTSVGIAFRDTYLTAYTNRVSEYKQALSVAQENIRVNMQKESESYADYISEYEKIKGVNLCSYKKIRDAGFTYASALRSDGSFLISHTPFANESYHNGNADIFGLEGQYLANTQYTIWANVLETSAPDGLCLYMRFTYSDGSIDWEGGAFKVGENVRTSKAGKTIQKIWGTYSTGSSTRLQVKLEVGVTPTTYSIPLEDEVYLANQTIAENKAYVNTLGTQLQNQIDGVVDSYFMEGEPTTSNKPASDWTTDALKQRHIGDTYTDISEVTLLGSWLFTQGWYNTSAGTIGSSTTSITTKDFLENKGGILYVPSGWQIGLYYFDANKAYKTMSWIFSNTKLNTTYPYYRVSFFKNSDPQPNITPSVADEQRLCVNPTAGQSWRWCNTTDEYGSGYHWHKIADNDAVKALQIASKAQDSADGKRRVFTSQPTPPYEVGDLWANAGTDNDFMRCQTAKTEGQSYSSSDWISASSALVKAKDAQNSVNNLKIGGVNLLPRTQHFLPNSALSSYSVLSTDTYKDFRIRYYDATSLSSNYMEFAAWNNINQGTNNDEFTCSFYAKGSGQVQVYLYSNSYNGLYAIKTTTSQGNTWTKTDGESIITLTGNWTRYWITWKLGNPSSITTRGNNLLFRLFKGNALYLCGCQLEQGNKATEWKPNDADKIEARDNILKNAMMVTLNEFACTPITLTNNIKANTEYVFSIENVILNENDSNSSAKVEIYATSNGKEDGLDPLYTFDVTSNTKFAQVVIFTQAMSTLYLATDYLTAQFIGVKLAEGNVYTGWQGTQEEQQALMALSSAMKGTTDIIGGLMLTNLIGMKGENNAINAGISGLDSLNKLRFWAGASWAGAGTAPFRVYNDGRVFGTHFYGFFSAFEVNASNISSVSSTSGSYKQLNLNVTGSNILLNYSSAYVTLPSDIKYVGSEVQIYNPNRYSIPTCNFVPYYSQCTIKNYEQTVSLTRTSYLGAISVSRTGGVVPGSISVPRWSVQMNTCSNYKPAYVKFRAVKTTLSLISGYDVYVPYWLKNCLYSGSISNMASYPFGDSQAYYLVNTTCTFVIWIMVEYSTTMS